MRKLFVVAGIGLAIGLACGGGAPPPSVASPAVEADMHFGALGLTVPDGWTVTNEGRSATLAHASGWFAKSLGPLPVSDRQQALDTLLPTLAADMEVGEWKLKEGFTTGGVPVTYGSSFVKVKGHRAYLVPVALSAGDGVLLLVGTWKDGFPKDELVHFGALLSGFSTSEPGFPSPGDQALDGFYVGFGSRTGVTAAATVIAEAGTRSYTFLPDGRYAFSDKAMVDPEAYCRTYPKNCGRYSVRGGTLAMVSSGSDFASKMGIGRLKERPFRARGSSLVIGDLTHQRIEPSDGLALDGAYYSGSGGTAGAVSVFASTDFYFSRAGRFARGDAAAVAAANPGAMAAGSSDRKRSGRYRVEGYELVLDYDDGSTERNAFFVYEGMLIIDGSPYTRR